MDISKRLKTVRGKLNQEDFAKVVGVSKMTVGRWERGERAPDFENLHKILELYPDINPTWLLSGEGAMKKECLDIEPEGYSNYRLLIAKKFRIIRGDKSIEEFCSDFHWHKEDWWEIEEDLKSPSWVLLYRICHDLGISPSWLIEDEGPMLKAELCQDDIKVCQGDININMLRDIIKESEVYESVNPGTLTPEKKADLIAELYRMRVFRSK